MAAAFSAGVRRLLPWAISIGFMQVREGGSHEWAARRIYVPLYEYECSNCHHRFERIESFSAPDRQKCPECGKVAKRVLTAPAIQFKGSGWYVTDYARKKSSPGAAPASGEKTSGSTAEKGTGTAEKASSDKKD